MSIAQGKFELELMRGYEESFRQRMSRVISLSYDCIPLNIEEYTQKVMEVLESIKPMDPNEKDLSLYDDIILGKIEGQPASSNFKQIVESVVGEVSEEKLKAYLKQKSQQRTFGASNKDKNCCIRQVKKIQSLQKYFDVQEISKKRKYNKLYSASIKSLAKYFDLYAKIDQNNPSTIQAAFQQYNIYTKEQKKFSQYVKDQEQIKNIVEKPPVVEEIKIQPEGEAIAFIEEQHKIAEVEQNKQKDDENKNKTEKETKTSKKSKGKKKESKPEEGPQPEKNSEEASEKDDKKDKQNEKQKEKELRRKQKEEQKIVKKPNNKLLTEFFSFKKKENPEASKKLVPDEQVKTSQSEGTEQQNSPIEQVKQPPKKQSIWDTFGQNQQQTSQTSYPSMSCLRQQFRGYRMQNEQYNPEPYFTNIVITLSTIEYYDYLMQIGRDVDLREPFKKIRDVLYFEDESEEFEGESADLEAEEDDQEEEDELSEGNHTILSDDHLSNEELSSCEVENLQFKIEYGKGRKWIVNFISRSSCMQSEEEIEICNSFSMICLQTDQSFPLRLDQEEEAVQFVMTPELWRDFYKLAHGYHGTKQSIIKDLSALLPGVSKNWIDTTLRERSQKIGNQRFIKKDFIDDIKEKVPQIDLLLQKVLENRNEELRKIKAEKNQEKDLKLQKDILECTGSRYIVNLIKQLKEKGYKQMRRNQLVEFINERKGEEWQSIKVQMNTMSRPIDQLIRNMPASEKIDQEVEVDDQEYKKMQAGEKKQSQSNSDASTKDKNCPNSPPVKKEKGRKRKQTKNDDKRQEKLAKIKRRKHKQKNSINIYEKTKPINRARNTKNSLKTGIPSIDELKRQKEEQKKLSEQQQNENDSHEENLDNEEQSSHSSCQNSPMLKNHLQNVADSRIDEINSQKNKQQQKLENMDEEKKSIEKSIILSEPHEQKIQSSPTSPLKQAETASKSEKNVDDHQVTFSIIEQQ